MGKPGEHKILTSRKNKALKLARENRIIRVSEKEVEGIYNSLMEKMKNNEITIEKNEERGGILEISIPKLTIEEERVLHALFNNEHYELKRKK